MNKSGFYLWFRIKGYGVSISTEPPLFSERNGYRKTIRLFGIKFELLTPRKLL